MWVIGRVAIDLSTAEIVRYQTRFRALSVVETACDAAVTVDFQGMTSYYCFAVTLDVAGTVV